MKEVRLETIIISKEAWKFLRQEDRKKANCRLLTDEGLEKIWKRIWRNFGASNETHPIGENEVRIERDTFNQRWDRVKEILKENGFEYRTDGFVVEAIYC